MQRRNFLKFLAASSLTPSSLVAAQTKRDPSDILIDANSFEKKGGWLTDPQFIEQMGSPYLLAHGMGKPVDNASTTITSKVAGKYHVWVRTKNWCPGKWDAPGQFKSR